jgi:cysteinyl-tRNA synthetase
MLNFTEEALQQARTSLNRVLNLLFELTHIERDLPPDPAVARAVGKARQDFIAGLEDDLNISEALAALFELVRTVNTLIARGTVGKEDARLVIDHIREVDENVLACLTGEVGAAARSGATGDAEGGAEVLEARFQALIEARQNARAAKDFKRADEIRRELLEAGILVEDTKDGVRWKKVGAAKP